MSAGFPGSVSVDRLMIDRPPPFPEPQHRTSSMSVRKAAVEMGLDWEKTRKMVSCCMGTFFS